MFEKLLEKILLSYFGKFISGFDKNNLQLGVWSGNIVIENVQLKPDLISALDLPIVIKFSSLGRMILKVPWNKLSSAPVEVVLEDILVVLNPLPEKQWKFDDSIYARKKLQKLLSSADKQKTSDQQGYFEKMTVRIIDNLQLSLRNIHIRYEDATFSWGIKLDSLEAVTTNEQFVRCFVDRSEERNRNAPMNKLINLQNLQFYWNAAETLYITEYTPPEQLILDQVIQINAACQLTMNLKSAFHLPLYSTFMELQSINVNFKHSQLKQLIRVLENVSQYTKQLQLWNNRKKQVAVGDDEHEFIELFTQLLKQEQHNVAELEGGDKLMNIVLINEMSALQGWVKQSLKQVLLDQKVQALQKQKSKRSWLGWKTQGEVQEHEIQEIQEFIEKSMDTGQSTIKRPEDSIQLKALVKLNGAVISLFKDQQIDSEEGLRQSCTKVQIEYEQRGNKDFSFGWSIQSVGMQLIRDKKVEQLVQPAVESNEFLKLGLAKMGSQLKVVCHIQSLISNYNPSVVRIFREIMKVKSGQQVENTLKTATWDKLEQIQDTTESKLNKLLESTIHLSIDFYIDRPIVILPFSTAANSECWVLKMGRLSIQSKSEETFEVQLLKGCFEYHPDRNDNNILSVVQDYSSSIEICREVADGKRLLRISGKLEPFTMVLNEKVYKDMIYLPETIFPKQNQQQTLQILQLEKQNILRNKVQSGQLKRCGDLIRSWTPYYAVLSGCDIYFYDSESSLMANNSISVFNSAVSRLIVDDQLYAFKITNKSQDCILACDNEEELSKWITILNQQIQEYTTRDASDKQRLIAKRKQAAPMHIQIIIRKVQLKLYKDNTYPSTYQEHLLFLFKINQLKFIKTPTQQVVEIDSLSLQDWVFDFTNPQMQDLIVISSTDSVALTFTSKSDTHKKISIDIESLFLNWKPDSFLKIRDLIMIIKNRKSRKWYFANVRDYEVEILKRGSNCDYEEIKRQKLIDGLHKAANKCMRYAQSKLHVQQKFFTFLDFQEFINDNEWVQQNVLSQFPQAFKSNTQLLMEVSGHIKSAQINLVHRTSHATSFKVEIDSAGFVLRKLQFSNFLDGQIKEASIHGMTNHPETVDSNLHYADIKPFKMIGKRNEYAENMIRFRFGGHDETILVSKDRTNMFLYLEISPIFAIYQHQPIMRTIDYIINQVVSLIKEPESLTMNTAYLEQKRRKSVKNPLKARRAWGEADFIQAKYVCPTFLDLRIKITKPLLVVKGWMQFTEYFQIDAETITVYNRQNVDRSRLLSEGGRKLIETAESWMPDGRIRQAWAEAYCVEGRNMQIQYVEEGKPMGISTPINFNLSFERLLHFNEVNEIYNNVQYDRSIRIRSIMSPIVLKLFRKEYLEICRLIFHNFNYDDQSDRIYIHDFEVARSFDPPPISFWLDFEEVAIFALSKRQNKPLLQLRIKQLRLQWLRGEDIDLNLFGRLITMYHYNDDEIVEHGFLGDLNKSQNIELSGIKHNLELDYSYYEHIHQELNGGNFIQYQFPASFDEDLCQFVMLFHITRPSGDKEISITLKNVKMVVEQAVFANIGLWSLLEQPCWPPQKEYGEMPAIKLIVEILGTSLCLQGLVGNQVIATKGDISYVWNRARFLHPERLIGDLKQGILDKSTIDSIGEAFEHKVNLRNLELFKCVYDDFEKFDMSAVHKRHIILPFSMFLCIKNELQMDYQQQCIYFINKYSFHIDKTVCKFSYQDLVLFLNIADKLKSSKTEIIREPIYGLPPPQQFITPVNNVYDIIVLGLQVVVINDAGEAYVPVFDLTLYETQLQYQQTNIKSIFSTVIKMSSTFYNPKIAIWEPIIECCMFSLDVSLNPQGDPQKIIFLEMTQQKQILNINISAQMVSVFHKTFLSWKKEMANDKEIEEIKEYKEVAEPYALQKQQSQQILIQSIADDEMDNIDYVSPYTIRNETGFILEVEDNIRKYVLKAGTSVNFQIDSEIEQVFSLDQSGKRLVTLKVVHPDYLFDPIIKVDMDAIRVRRITIHPINKDMQRTFMLFIEVVPKDTRKLLLISSEMILFNRTNRSLELRMYDQQGHKEVNEGFGQVEPMRAFSIPFDRTRSFLNFRFQGGTEFSRYIDLALLAENNEKKYEYQHAENFTIVRCSKRIVNQTLLYLEPPYQIKNCLPLDISYELFGDTKVNILESIIQSQADTNDAKFPMTKEKAQFENLGMHDKGLLAKQELKQIHTVSFKGRLAIKIKLPYHQLSDMGLLHLPKQQGNIIIDAIQVCDYRGSVTNVNVEKNKSTYYLYSPLFAINELAHKLFFYTPQENKKSTAQLISGQSFKDIPLEEEENRIVLMTNIPMVQISGFDNGSWLTEPINLNYTGNQTIKMQTENGIEEIGYNISLVCVDRTKPVVTKVLTISPRFVIINKTNFNINILQDQQFTPLEVATKDRAPFYWTGPTPNLIRVQILDPIIDWEYSNPIDPNSTGFSCFTLRTSKNSSIVKHMNCITRQDNQIIYLIILECKLIEQQPKLSQIQEDDNTNSNEGDMIDNPYVIINNLPMVMLVCYQQCCSDIKYAERYPLSEYKQLIPPMNSGPFTWEFPDQRRELVVELRFQGDLSMQYQLDPLYFRLEEGDAAQEFVLNNLQQEMEQFKFIVSSVWEGSSRKLKFMQDLPLQQDDHNILKLDINVSQVGISLVDFEQNRRVELIYVTLKGVEISIQETQQTRKSELKIKYINIDSNSNYKTMFPVIWTPTKYKQIYEFNRPHLSLVVEQSTQVNTVSLIKSIKACLQPTTVRLTSEMLEQLFAVYKSISQQFKTNVSLEEATKLYDFEYSIQQHEQEALTQINTATLSNKVQLRYGIGSPPNSKQLEWQEVQLSLADKATYINRIEIYPLNFHMTFYNSVSSQISYGILLQILKTIGIVLGNIDEAPIKLDGIYLENCFDTTAAIIHKLITHYKDKLVNMLLKILGSIEILGNPVGLVKHLARGVYDLFDQPIEGFIKGPIEGGIGIAKGVGSLAKNTISGTSNSMSKITGSFGGGLAAISFDPKYQGEREQLRVVKPRQLIAGVATGGVMCAIGFKRGLVGVVDLPYQGMRVGGARGALLGTVKGSAGFFIKPFAGIFDFISKTTDGIKATAQYWDDKANEKRERDIRVLYSIEQYYKSYNEKDSELFAFVVGLSVKYSLLSYLDGFEFGSADYKRALVLSQQLIINVDMRKKRVVWCIDPKLINSISGSEQGVVYQLKEFNEKLGCSTAQLEIDNEDLKDQIINRSRQLMKILSGL